MTLETWMIPISVTIFMFFLAIIEPKSTYSHELGYSPNNGLIGAFWISVIAWVWWYLA